jgi:NADH-quinone oxidoreductase subunit L
MTIPLWILSFFAIVAGFFGSPWFGSPFQRFIAPEEHVAAMNYPLAGVTLLLALLAIFLAYRMYGAKPFVREPMATEWGPFYVFLARRYYLDELYNWMIATFILAVSRGLAWFDMQVIDRIVDLFGWITDQIGNLFRHTETGRVPNYALGVFAGIAVLVFVMLSYAPVGR